MGISWPQGCQGSARLLMPQLTPGPQQQQGQSSPAKKKTLLVSTSWNAASMTAGRPGQVSVMEKAPWMPDFQKDERVQYFLVGKVSHPDNLSLAQPHVPLHPQHSPVPPHIPSSPWHLPGQEVLGTAAHPSLKKCSSPLISVIASKFFSTQASRLGSTGMGSAVGSGVSSSSSVVEVLPASVGMGSGSLVGTGAGAVGLGPEPRPEQGRL